MDSFKRLADQAENDENMRLPVLHYCVVCINIFLSYVTIEPIKVVANNWPHH